MTALELRGRHLRRREFIKVIAASTAAWPLAARAQQPALPVIGFLSSLASSDFNLVAPPFFEGLNETGFVDGRNITIEIRWAEAQQIAACNAIHSGSPRLCRWLLQAADWTGSDHIPLTQEFLADMLGVRRTTVTLLARLCYEDMHVDCQPLVVAMENVSS
jgi:hypothetical protein